MVFFVQSPYLIEKETGRMDWILVSFLALTALLMGKIFFMFK